ELPHPLPHLKLSCNIDPKGLPGSAVGVNPPGVYAFFQDSSLSHPRVEVSFVALDHEVPPPKPLYLDFSAAGGGGGGGGGGNSGDVSCGARLRRRSAALRWSPRLARRSRIAR